MGLGKWVDKVLPKSGPNVWYNSVEESLQGISEMLGELNEECRLLTVSLKIAHERIEQLEARVNILQFKGQ